MRAEELSITLKINNYEEIMLQLEDIRRSADAVLSILTAMAALGAWGGYCPHCGKKIINESEE